MFELWYFEGDPTLRGQFIQKRAAVYETLRACDAARLRPIKPALTFDLAMRGNVKWICISKPPETKKDETSPL